jgi:acyl carrier protein
MAKGIDEEVLGVLRSVLDLGPRGQQLGADSALLGSVAELDSMAVVSILTALEEKFGFSIDDDEIDGRTFVSVASLCKFVRSKLDS